ncbi:MAG: Com family DNA-binding transcriptional regulator [Pirellulales bacterium]|nr:Com family DNA-binding transcriptional regulator [Pirellulales bacterium]
MASEFRCGQCDRLLHVGDARPGTRILCPECGAFSTVSEGAAGPIEFRCSQCNKLLRTGAETAGKQAKCPKCGAITTVPQPGAQAAPDGRGSPFAARDSQPSAADSSNPYASPAAYAPAATWQADAAASRVFAPRVIDFDDVFRRTWSIFKPRWGMCLAAVVIVWAISLGFNLVVSLGFNIAAATARDDAIHFLLMFFSNVINNLFQIWLNIGLALYFLRIARGQRVELSELFRGGPYFLPVLGASILMGLACVVGFLACIVPGVIVALMFSQFYYLILDRNAGVIESLTLSHQITTGNKLTLFLIGLVSGLGGLVVVVFTCGLGLLVVGPFLTLLSPVIYLAMTGQPTADQIQSAPPLSP